MRRGRCACWRTISSAIPRRSFAARKGGRSDGGAYRGLIAIALVAAAARMRHSAPARFYTLDSTATPDGAPAAHVAVMVGPVSVPAAVDQPQFVVQVAPNRVEVDEFNRWAAPLSDSIARAVAGDLAVLLGTPDVATAPLANFNPAYSVTIDVQRFESTRRPGGAARGSMDRARPRAARRARAARSRARRCRATASTRSPPPTAARSRS